MRIRPQYRASFLENSDCLHARDGWELLQEHVKRVAFFEVVEQVLDGHACAGENRCAALDIGVNDDEGAAHGASADNAYNDRGGH